MMNKGKPNNEGEYERPQTEAYERKNKLEGEYVKSSKSGYKGGKFSSSGRSWKDMKNCKGK
jgi:hypothetical protein